MELVIELSELDYKWITLRKGDETLYPLTLTVYEAIKNGTPLPPHGRLIDADALIFNADYNEPLISKWDFDYAPTILEATKTN